MSGSAAERLVELQRSGTTTGEALAFFDALPPATLGDVRGEWRGTGLRTGHPFDGLLEKLGWYGKRFDGPDDAHPLLFRDRHRGVAAVDPRWVPVPVVTRFPRVLRTRAVLRLAPIVLPVLRTSRPRGRLRMMEHRGVVTATLVYDALPVHDHLRRVDEHTLLGLMDLRGMPAPYFFVLRRDVGAS